MSTTVRIAIPLLSLLFAANEAAAQFPIRPRRPPLSVPADHRPAVGVVFGPSARAAESESDGIDVAESFVQRHLADHRVSHGALLMGVKRVF